MIQTNVTIKGCPSFRILTDDQIAELSNVAMEILEKVGYKILHAGARKMLKQAGALVSGEIVKVPEHIVTACLRTEPIGMTQSIFSRASATLAPIAISATRVG